MPGETTVVKAKYAEGTDEVNKFPAEVSAPGAKSFDKYLEEKVLRIKKYAGGGTLASGELAYQELTAQTFTLPLAATENQYIGAYSTVAETKITTSGGTTISGDFVVAEATIVLSTNQHVILQSVNGKWIIIAGEPKRTQTYGANKTYTKVEMEAGIEPSATRPAYIVFAVASVVAVKIGGVTIAGGASLPVGGSYLVPPGQKVVSTAEAQFQILLQ